MLWENDLGGVNEDDKAALHRAKEADLITLPKKVKGTNCYNCKWISEHKTKEYGMCTQPKIRQYVNGRMCCGLWTRDDLYRPFKMSEKYK